MYAPFATAIEALSVSAERVESVASASGPSVDLANLAVAVGLAPGNAVSIAASADLRGVARQLIGDGIKLECAADGRPGCSGGVVALRLGQAWRESEWSLSLADAAVPGPAPEARAAAPVWQLSMAQIAARAFRLAVEADGDATGWRSTLKLRGVSAPRLAGALKGVLPPDLAVTSGVLRATVALSAEAAHPSQPGAPGKAAAMAIGGTVNFAKLEFSNEAGTLAAEGLGGTIGVSRSAAGWTQLSLGIPAGVAWFEPLLLDAGEGRLSARATVSPDRRRISKLRVAHEGQLAATGAVRLGGADGSRLDGLVLSLPDQPVAPAWQQYLAPLLAPEMADDISVAGRISADVDWRRGNGAYSSAPGSTATVRLAGARLARGEGPIELDGLAATLHWRPAGEVPASDVRWSSGTLRAFDIGAASARLALVGESARLLRPLSVPFVEGELHIARLAAEMSRRGPDGSVAPRLEIDARLAPMPLARITERLGWPPLAGQLSGEFSQLSLHAGGLNLDGTLGVRVFDGEVRVRDLAIADLFGSVPSLRASVALDRISLEPLTAAFDFGRITGRVSGHINDLYLQGARPITFDALVETPRREADDDLPHRISQRAVDNLTSLGGASGTLASTFLGLFESFRYDRLGLGCTLRAGRCQMRGVADAPQGYYVVKGAGLPRVNVVGYNTDVDFDALVSRLASATRVQSPVVR